MPNKPLNITIIGLSLSSSWGNGHATTYRSLIKGLSQIGHQVNFLERNKSWYAENRDLNSFEFCRLEFFDSVEELKKNYEDEIASADLIIVGSFTPDGVEIGKWVTEIAGGLTAFYDIDTPVTLSKLEQNDYEYLDHDLVQKYDLYLSFTGGPILDKLVKQLHAPSALPLYCSVDTDLYFPEILEKKWELGYLGTYSDDRQPTIQKLLLDPAEMMNTAQFVVAGPQYPDEIAWPENVDRVEHLPQAEHREFYNSQRFTLNVTREAMIKTGFAPSVRLFEAAACATPIISDYWEGLDTIFKPDEEILIAKNSEEVIHFLNDISENERKKIGQNARNRILKDHSHQQRAKQLADYVWERRKIESAW